MEILSIGKRFNPLSANPTKWSNTLKQFVGNLPTNCLSVLDHFVILADKGLSSVDFIALLALLFCLHFCKLIHSMIIRVGICLT